jgi:hypothetical protein
VVDRACSFSSDPVKQQKLRGVVCINKQYVQKPWAFKPGRMNSSGRGVRVHIWPTDRQSAAAADKRGRTVC